MKKTLLIILSLCLSLLLQAQVSKTVNVSAGSLSTSLTATELNTVTNLTLSGTIDTRDFKTMRDNMPVLAVLDLSSVTVVAYSGTDGTSGTNSTIYPANTIPDYAFSDLNYNGKKSLTSFKIPSTVSSIGTAAFMNCSGLTSVAISSSIISIGYAAFAGCSGLITVDSGNPNYSSIDGVLFNKVQTMLIQCTISKSGSYVIPSSVTSIGNGAFQQCNGLTSVTIPSSVTSIDEGAFFYCGGLTGIFTIPSSVTSIGNYAFVHCNRLTSVTIPSSVSSIGKYTFQQCSGLTGIIIPSSVTSIGEAAFWDCSGLISITIPSSVTSIVDAAFLNCSSLTSITIPSSVTSIEDYVFSNCSSLTSIIIPSSVTSIGEGAFLNCSHLTGTLTIPASVTTIGLGAFQQCSRLTSVTIPSSVASIKSQAFLNCTSLTSIYTNRLTAVDLNSASNVFYNVNKATCKLYVPSGASLLYAAANQWKDFLNIIETGGFELLANKANIKATQGSIATVDMTSSIAWSAISDQTWLTVSPTSGASNQTLTFTANANPSSATRIATVTVSASGLASQTIVITQAPKTLNVTVGGLATALTASELNTVTNLVLIGTIDARDFKTMRDNMPLLAEIDLSGVTIAAYTGTEGTASTNSTVYPVNSIPDYAFLNNITWQGKTSLTSIVIPGSVTSIGNSAFYSCSNLSWFNIPTAITSIGTNAFGVCRNLSSVIIPSSVTSIGSGAFYACSGPFTVEAGNLNYSSIDGVLFNKLQTILINFPTSKTGSYVIPSSVTSIESSAFGNCSGLTSVTIPSSVTFIGSNTFGNCTGLTSVTIPSSVTSIGFGAFTACTGLTSVTIPASVTSIGSYAFQNCSSLTSIYANSANPVNLSSVSGVFNSVNKTNCTLHVPYGTKILYAPANQWKDFTTIVEMAEFKLSATTAAIAATGGTAMSNLTTGLAWSASSDQTWLTVTPASGTGNQTFTCTAVANALLSDRVAIVSVSATGLPSQTIVITQAGSPKTLNVTAGGLATALTANELSSISKLILSGTIDARDFKTMRDLMPFLAEIDLSGVTIATYSGTEGTNGTNNITYPANTVPDYAYYNSSTGNGKTSLTSIVLPSSVTAIGYNAFESCIGLTSVTIPSSVSSIGNYAFRFCSSLTSVNIPSSVSSIGTQAFFLCTASITVDAANTNFSAVDGVLFNKLQTTLIQCPMSKTGSYVIPSSVISIGSSAFNSCSGLATLAIPTSVTSIGDYAFYSCSGLTSVVIPSSVTTINNGTFSSCSGLTTVSIPSSVTSIGGYAFYNCSDLSKIYAQEASPVNLSSSTDVFYNVNKTSCTLYVPYGTKSLYSAANQWKDFSNIVEIPELKVSATTANILAAEGSMATLEITSNVSWTAGSDQNWLTVNPVSATGNKTMTFTAGANPDYATRIATVTVSSAGLESKTISVTQEGKREIQSIALNLGWNIISAYVVPANIDLKAIFQSLIDAGTLKKVMDEAGKTIENFGAFGDWKNNIGNLNSAKGYKVNVTAASTLSLEGLIVTLPLNIPLALGWNIISYPCSSAQDAKALVQPLIDSGQLKKVMDETGKTIENFGAFGGWKNNIGNFIPGKGYKVNVSEACTLSVTAPLNKSAVIVPEVLASAHFNKVFTGNGTDHFNVHLVDLASSGLKAGDQIGIFDGKFCVGAATIGLDQLISGNISIPASCNDEPLSKVNGFTVGRPVTLQLYRDNQTYPLTPAKVGGSESFEKNGSLFLKVTASDLPAAKISAGSDQVKCYPNPFVDQLTIGIRLTEPKNLEVKIYDLSGKLVRSLFKGEAGPSETLFWDGTNGNGAKMDSGTYILKANEMIEKVALKK